MLKISRRALLTAAAATPLSMVCAPFVAKAAAPRVVVVGGGPGGAAAARYLKRFAPSLAVTLIEAAPKCYACFMSNEAVVGARDLESLATGFDGLRAAGIDVVFDTVVGLDADARQIICRSGDRHSYDRCLIAPGVDFRFDAIPGYDAAAAEILPHAYKAGPQTALLARQLAAAPDGATFVMSVPANPYRCPPGPYERAGLIADYFKRHKPRSKVLILDGKDSFSKQKLFEEGWRRRFGYGTANSLIEWIPAKQGGAAVEIDAANQTVTTGAGRVRGDVVNVIPPQTAGALARIVGAAPNNGWAAVDARSFESSILPGVHVIGDAGALSAMPKSAFAAASQAKAAAAAIINLLNGRPPIATPLINACYSFVDHDYCFSIVGVYQADEKGAALVENKDAGGMSPTGQGDDLRLLESRHARAWNVNMRRDIWG